MKAEKIGSLYDKLIEEVDNCILEYNKEVLLKKHKEKQIKWNFN